MMDRRRMKLDIRDRILSTAGETEPEVPGQAVAWEAPGPLCRVLEHPAVTLVGASLALQPVCPDCACCYICVQR